MTGGYTDATTNYARMTVEKRGEGQTGDVAWRFLTTGEEAETVGAERMAPGFNDRWYFWQASWRHNHFNVLIREGGPNADRRSTTSASITAATTPPSRTSSGSASARIAAAPRARRFRA